MPAMISLVANAIAEDLDEKTCFSSRMVCFAKYTIFEAVVDAYDRCMINWSAKAKVSGSAGMVKIIDTLHEGQDEEFSVQLSDDIVIDPLALPNFGPLSETVGSFY